MIRLRSFCSPQRHFSTSSSIRAQVEVFVNNIPTKIEQGSAIIQACEKAGVSIPRFCYHKRLSVAGNCRMCLVQVEKAAKPVASCAMPVMPGMRILTDTPTVKKAREGVMEFLLSNHPLDCPVCDQGGECDLQDQSVRYGSDTSRFGEHAKRAVEDKNFGPLVKTSMNRCIHCTRCVRFANEVAGAEELGTSGRGNDMQIGTYIEQAVQTEMSGNIVDLCPVGALTSKPYAFTARPWELKSTESIDVLDGVGSNIRIDTRGLEVMRVLPRLNEDVNEEWINDKTRYAYDGLKRQRLTTPMIRQGDTFVSCSWSEALQTISHQMNKTKPENMLAIAGAFADAESLVALKDLFNKVDCENLILDTYLSTPSIPGVADLQSNYLFNSTINGVEHADWLLLIGTNPRHEAAIINTRIRKAFLQNNLEVGVIGESLSLNYEYTHVGQSISSLDNLKKNDEFFEKFAKCKQPMIIIGSGIFEREDAKVIMQSVTKFVQSHHKKFVRDDWNGFNILQRSASHAGAFEVGYTSAQLPKSPEFVYLLNADAITDASIPKNAFVVYQGHHGDIGAQYANVILPGSAYTEKSATFINTEGRTQTTRAAVSAPGAAREDWKIIRALSEVSGHTLEYDSLRELRNRMTQVSPSLTHYDGVLPRLFTEESIAFYASKVGKAGGKPSEEPLTVPIKDFYMTDCISRSSKIMAKCSQAFTYNLGYGAEKKIAV